MAELPLLPTWRRPTRNSQCNPLPENASGLLAKHRHSGVTEAMGCIDGERKGANLLRLVQVGLGVIVGAAVGGPAGVTGGAVLAGLAEVCGQLLWLHPTSPKAWLQAFGLAGCGGGAVAGVVQEGLEGAVLGAFVGGVGGCCAGLSIGVPVWAVARLAQRIAGPVAPAD